LRGSGQDFFAAGGRSSGVGSGIAPDALVVTKFYAAAAGCGARLNRMKRSAIGAGYCRPANANARWVKAQDSNAVYWGCCTKMGADPDPFIRTQILRDASGFFGGLD